MVALHDIGPNIPGNLFCQLQELNEPVQILAYQGIDMIPIDHWARYPGFCLASELGNHPGQGVGRVVQACKVTSNALNRPSALEGYLLCLKISALPVHNSILSRNRPQTASKFLCAGTIDSVVRENRSLILT